MSSSVLAWYLGGRRRALFVGLAMVVVLSAWRTAVAETPFFDLDDLGVEAFGGPHFRFTSLNGGLALLGGGPITVLLDRQLALGVTWSVADADVDDLSIAYGGLDAGYVLWPDGVVHLELDAAVGGGVVIEDDPTGADDRAGLLVVEPEALVSFSLTRSFRIGLGGGYRWVPLVGDGVDTSAANLSGPVGTVSLQYGVFGAAGERLDPPRIQISGFASAKLSTLAQQLTVLDGGGTRLLIGRHLAVGLTGYVSRRDVDVRGHEVGMGYGGVEVGWAFWPTSPLHLVVGGLIGIGGAGWTDPTTGDPVGATAVLVEPEALAELGLATFARLALGATWRQAIAIDEQPGLGASELSGPSAVIQLRFGWF